MAKTRVFVFKYGGKPNKCDIGKKPHETKQKKFRNFYKPTPFSEKIFFDTISSHRVALSNQLKFDPFQRQVFTLLSKLLSNFEKSQKTEFSTIVLNFGMKVYTVF